MLKQLQDKPRLSINGEIIDADFSARIGLGGNAGEALTLRTRLYLPDS
jgi:hypothetical protein